MNRASIVLLVSLLSALCCWSVATADDAAAGVAPAAGAISCYTCNEKENPSCGDPFKESEQLLKPCMNGEKFCRKTTQIVDGDTSIIRQCAQHLYKPDFEGCYKTAGKSTQTVCTCRSKDGKPCNSAVTYKSSALALASAVMLAVLVKF